MATCLKACIFSVMAYIALSTTTASAQVSGSDERRIQAAVLLDGLAEPILGEARCRFEKRCEIIAGSGSSLKVDVNLHRRGAVESADLTIHCPKECSFMSGRSNVTFQRERKFDLFRGGEGGVETLLVLKPRVKIGEIVLIVE
jgi:hypothetical protein